jgi:DNA replicative helicase MCM subunit Mcm2 (Cdc46/Mcm family)
VIGKLLQIRPLQYSNDLAFLHLMDDPNCIPEGENPKSMTAICSSETGKNLIVGTLVQLRGRYWLNEKSDFKKFGFRIPILIVKPLSEKVLMKISLSIYEKK